MPEITWILVIHARRHDPIGKTSGTTTYVLAPPPPPTMSRNPTPRLRLDEIRGSCSSRCTETCVLLHSADRRQVLFDPKVMSATADGSRPSSAAVECQGDAIQDHPTRPRKRQKIAQACDDCRARKVRCDGQRPQCGACERRYGGQQRCHYPPELLRASNHRQYDIPSCCPHRNLSANLSSVATGSFKISALV